MVSMKKLIVKRLTIISIVFLIVISFCLSVNANNKNSLNQSSYNSLYSIDYTDITVEEAWDLLNDTSNGIQIPIDVRTNNEWKSEHILTPKPENPRHHNFYDWDDEQILLEFMSLYDGKELIIYCRSGGRSVSAINILIDNGFNGVLYNMLGGITEWKEIGLPTIPNLPPEDPEISGIFEGKVGENYEYMFISSDPDDDELYFYINWSDNSTEEWIGPYNTSESVMITHNWTVEGTYLIQAKVRDKYGDESNWSTFEVTMPKNKSFNIPNILFCFFEKFPFFNHIFSYIKLINS
jgi:rhodanese-related sulfurtransferase